MASIFGHAALVLGGSKLVPNRHTSLKIIILCFISSIIPDIDVMAFSFGVDDQHPLGHRGLTHSIPFALIWACVLYRVFHYREGRNVLFLISLYTLSMVSHGLLDAFTTGGEGVAFFYPFDDTRYFMPWRVIEVSPVGIGAFFSEWGLAVLKSELVYIFLPAIGLYYLGSIFNKYIYK